MHIEEEPLLEGGNPLARKCPYDDCIGVAIAPDFSQKEIGCPVCYKTICFVCSEKIHPDLTCEENMELNYRGIDF